jgi:aerobic carbon-monoxide dehydrogenase large subunit
VKIFGWRQNKDKRSNGAPSASKLGVASIGAPISRIEDARLVTGCGQFVDDIDIGEHLNLAFVRSPLPKGRIVKCDVTDVLAMPDVLGAYTGADVAALGNLSVNRILSETILPDYPVLAQGNVSAVGQPVAAVLAKNIKAAQDALDYVELDIDESENFLLEPTQSSEDTKPQMAQSWSRGDVDEIFAQADHVVEVAVDHPRLAPSPMECRAISIKYHPESGNITVYLSTQTPHRAKNELSRILNIPKDMIHVIAPDVGGSFGMKASLYPEEVFACWVALKHQQSVKWISTRMEDLMSASHGRGISTKGELAFDTDGMFLGLKAQAIAPLGNWLTNSSAVPTWNAMRMLPGPYNLDAVSLKTQAIMTHTAPVGIYRGAGRPEATMLMERLVDKAAKHLQMCPIEIRRLNLLTERELPRRNAADAELDSGDYLMALEMLLEKAEYGPLKSEYKRRRNSGELCGLGVCFYVEPCGQGWESASVTLNPDGTIVALSGGSSQGHGRETAFSQILSDLFSVDMSDITLKHGSTETCPEGIGALASRSTAIGGSALLKAGQEALAKAGGKFPPQEPVTAEVKYENDGEAWGYGAYLAEVTVDAQTGYLTVLNITCVDDAGLIINPTLVDGQIMGGIAQGVGEALMEQVRYSDDGQLITGSLMDYAIPRASDMPNLSISKMQTPSPKNILGAKGVGEAGTIAAPAAILSATIDALQDFDTTDLQMPLTSEKLWKITSSPNKENETDEI